MRSVHQEHNVFGVVIFSGTAYVFSFSGLAALEEEAEKCLPQCVRGQRNLNMVSDRLDWDYFPSKLILHS